MRVPQTRGPAEHVVALAGLAVLAAGYVWPLLSRLTTAMPGGPTDLDVATMVWNVGWIHHALTTGAWLLHSDDVLVPFGADLRLHTYGLFQGLLVAPLVPLIGVLGAFNLMLLGTLWLNGTLLYVLAAAESGRKLAAFVAALCFMLAPPILDQVRVGRPTFASLWIVSAALLVVRAMSARPRAWQGALLGALLVAAVLTDLQIALFAGLWLAVFGLARLRPRHWRPLAIASVLVALPIALLYLPALSADDYPRPSLDDMREYSFRVWDIVDPATAPHMYGFPTGAIALAALALRGARHGRIWVLGGLAFVLLSLGPFLQPTQLPMPFAMLSAWPPLSQFRTPYRMGMPAMLGLGVGLSLVVAWLLDRWSAATGKAIAAAIVAAQLGVALAFDPLLTQTYPSYPVYSRLAAEPERFTLLEVPIGVRSGLERIGSGGEALEYYQHLHGKPIINGMIARLPHSVFATYAAFPALRVLSGETTSATADDFDKLVAWTGARYVLVHPALLDETQASRIGAFLAAQPSLEPPERDQDVLVYRVTGGRDRGYPPAKAD